MSFSDEYNALRKKRKAREAAEKKTSIEAPLFVNKTAALYAQDDVAPVKKGYTNLKSSGDTFRSTKKKEEKEDDGRSWFQKGAFEDGYQFGDVTKAILGTETDVRENLAAGILGMGEKLVDAGAYVAGGVGKAFGADEFAEKTKKFISKDLYDEEKIAEKIILGWGFDADESSVLGEKTDSLVQSGGQLGATIGLQMAGVPWFVTTGVTSFGGEVEGAFDEDATYGEAGVSAAISAGAEILTEKISGGIKFGGKALDDVVTKRIARGVSNKVVRTLSKLGMDMAGEGTEEVLSGVMGAVGQKITYADDKELTELFSTDEALESFIGGAVLGGSFGGINAVKSKAQGVDYASGLTENEKKVVDKVFEDRVAEEEKNGKLTEKQKDEIYDKVLNEMERGQISTDTIEEVLGGKTYEDYSNTVLGEDTIFNEYEELGKKKDATLAEQTRYKELHELIPEIKKESQREQLKSRLGEEVFGLVKGDRLVESYNERAKRGQAFEADLTQYDEKQQETIKKAAESGILNNTRRTHEFVDMIAKISADKGVLFDFTDNQKLKDSGFAIDGKEVNGYVTKDGITLNVNSAKALNSVVGHEITHVLEGTELYTELQNVLKTYAESKGEYQSRYDALTKLYDGVKDANIDAELTADLVGDYLFTDSDFINNLSTNNRNVFQKIYDEVKYLCKVATAGSKEARELEKVKRAFEKAYKAEGKADGNTKYSVTEHTAEEKAAHNKAVLDHFGKTYNWAETGYVLLDGTKLDLSGKHEGAPGGYRTVDHRDIVDALGSNYGDGSYSGSLVQFMSEGNIRISPESDGINLSVKPTKAQEQALSAFISRARGEVLLDIDGLDGYTEVSVEYPRGTHANKVLNDIREWFDNGKKPEVSNTSQFRYSLSDSNGKELSKEQQEYFKDSKARDENGNLQLVYHGTRKADFTVFNRTANFYTDSKEMAESYAPNSEMYEGYVNITNPFVIDAQGDRWSGIAVDNELKKLLEKYGSSTFKERGKWRTSSDDIVAAISEMVDEGEADYDGVIIRNVDDTGSYFKGEGGAIGTDYITFSSNQFKNADNLNPTTDKDIRRSMSENGEAPVYGNYNVFGKDIALEAPVREEVVAENATTTKEIAPTIDDDTERFESLTDADAPPPRNRSRLFDVPEEQTMTVEERRAAKLKAVQTELAENTKYRMDSLTDYNQEIAKLQAQYDAKKNKNTKVANDILRRIERVKRLRDSVDADYAKRISDLQTREKLVREGKPTTRQEYHKGIVDNIKDRFKEKGFDFDNVLRKAKNLSTFSTVDNTPQRVMEKALGYKEGQVLSDLTVNKVAQNETEGIKWLNSFTDRKNGLLAQISKQYNIKPGSKESAAAQMYAEGFYVDDNNDIIQYGDAELAQDFPNAKVQANIKGLANDARIRQIYDETLSAINESRTRNAYPEIPRLENYFLHFRAMEDTFSRLGLPFNPNDIRAKDLPTDLNGVTADLKPGQPFFASAMHRTGQRTSFDLLGGLERYLSSAKNQIYHIDDIQTLRALRNYIADTYGQAKGLENLDSLSEEEAQERIKEVYGAHLSTFAKFLNEEANVLAGKTALIDRGLEGVIGRRGMTFLDTVNRQVGSNMVGLNVSSSLTNFLPVVQTFAKGNKAAFVKAFAQTVAHKVSGRSDGFAENSPVMIRRKGADRFYRTPWQKAGDVGYTLMGAVDNISTELIARTKYNELVSNGMDSQKAHYETDKWVSRLMGDRSLGQQPQMYNSKMLGLLTKFQLEVRNQLDSQFYDTIQEAKVSNEHIENELARNAKTAAKVASTFFQLAVLQNVFGKAFESVAGYNPAFDIIEVLMTAFGFDDDEDSEDTVVDNIEQGFLAMLEDLPYASTFLDGGRIPISSALPIGELVKGEDEWGNEKSRWETLGEIAPYYALPTGYGQIKKTAKGLNMFSDEHPIAGSYTDSGNLRFPVEDTLGNRVKAGIFGQYASENARSYFDNERTALNENQIQEFEALGVSYDDYWAYRDDANRIHKRAEENGASDEDILKSKYINSVSAELSEILAEKQEVMSNPELLTVEEKARELSELDKRFARLAKERFNSYNDVSISGKHATVGSRQFRWYEPGEDAEGEPGWRKLTDKQIEKQEEVTSGLGISPSEYWSNSEEYNYAYKYPGNYAIAKSVGGYSAYKEYSSALYDIKADKDEDGKSITGSRKEKVIDWLNRIDADYYEKIILYKSEYPADDTYNREIIEYLNGRNDISYEEMVTILKELGFTVNGNNVSW